MSAPRAIAEWHGVDRATFERDIVPRYEPAVLRGLVADWPAVQRANDSDLALARYLTSLDSGEAVEAVMVPPGRGGRLFYADDWNGFNFLRQPMPISQVIEQVLRYVHFDNPPAVAVQSAVMDSCAPSFATEHRMPLLDATVRARLWMGNAIVTPTHFDESSNIACVVAGSRRFTLFAPEQVANLYVGPIGNAPTGTPISLVDLAAVDRQRFPRFEAAQAAALQAELRAGDALYIPPLWWHHVVSLARFNVLVNYWWSAAPGPSGLDLLLHALQALRALPPSQRLAWRALFDHWVFTADDTTSAHIEPAMRGVHGRMTAALQAQIGAYLRSKSDP